MSLGLLADGLLRQRNQVSNFFELFFHDEISEPLFRPVRREFQLRDEGFLHLEHLHGGQPQFVAQAEDHLLDPGRREDLTDIGVAHDLREKAQTLGFDDVRILGRPDDRANLCEVRHVFFQNVLLETSDGGDDVQIIVSTFAAVIEVMERSSDDEIPGLPLGHQASRDVVLAGGVAQPHHVEQVAEVVVRIVEVLGEVEDHPVVVSEVSLVHTFDILDDIWNRLALSTDQSSHVFVFLSQ